RRRAVLGCLPRGDRAVLLHAARALARAASAVAVSATVAAAMPGGAIGVAAGAIGGPLDVVQFVCREIGERFGLLWIFNCGLCLLEGVVRPETAVVQQRVGWTPFVELHHQAKLLARVVADKSREAIAVIFRVFVGVRQVLPAHRFALVSNFRFTVFAEPPQSHSPAAAANADRPARPWRGRWCALSGQGDAILDRFWTRERLGRLSY